MADLLYVGTGAALSRRLRVARKAACVAHRIGTAVNAGAGEGPADEAFTTDDVALPESAWSILIPLASDVLSTIRPDDLPGPLRRFARFAPVRRAKLAAGALRNELTDNPTFRQRVAESARRSDSEVVAAIDRGEIPPSASGDEVAALTWMLRPEGWQDLLAAGRDAAAAEAEASEVNARIKDAEQRASSAEHDRATAVRDVEKLRVELTEARAEATEMRNKHREAAGELRELKRRERKLSDALSSEKGRRKQDEQRHATEVKRLKAQLEESKQDLEQARRGARDSRDLNETRLWLLLETIGDAASGLRRELSLDPSDRSPADFVTEAEVATTGTSSPQAARGLRADDPGRLNDLLSMPHSHLIVDGYNVTIGGYGEMPLEQQRQRLVRGLSGLAAQTATEVTVVFDGSDRMVGLPTPPRGVRVLFSRKNQTADDVIRSLVRAEPNGRPIIVVSSDREVAESVQRHGAYPLSAATLLRRLERN